MNVNRDQVGERRKCWYALRVKARSERMVAALVRQKGFEEFVPVYICKRRWSDRLKQVALPLFPGYVFCRLDPTMRLPVLTIPGAQHFVGIRNSPTAIDDAEMLAIQMATQSGLYAEPWPYLEAGRPVKVQSGPLAKLEGLLVQADSRCRLVLSMRFLRRSMAVEIDPAWIERWADGAVETSPSISHLSPDLRPSCEDNN